VDTTTAAHALPERDRKDPARRPDTKAAIVHERGYLNLSLDFEDVAEFTYRPGKCTCAYRIVVLRKNISRSRGDHALLDEIRYFFYVTTYTGDTHTPAQIVELANERCDQENIIGQLKSGINALRVPLYDLVSNWAYMVIAALAWNLKSWFAMMMPAKPTATPTSGWSSGASSTTSSASPPWSSAGPAPSLCGSSATPPAWTGSSASGPPPNASGSDEPAPDPGLTSPRHPRRGHLIPTNKNTITNPSKTDTQISARHRPDTLWSRNRPHPSQPPP